jgi:starch-binding outer membrane protein, SusD/RagB family
MKKVLYKSIIILVFSATIISCSEDFLKPEPLSFYSPTNTLKTGENLRAVLRECSRFAYLEYSTGDNAPFINELWFSESAVGGTNDQSDLPVNMDVQCKAYPSDYLYGWLRIGNFWKSGYNAIKNANIVINRLPDAEVESLEEYNQILGEAYFHRAYWYYRLVNQFGDVPWIDKEIQEPKINYYSNTRESILAQIENDLEFAELHVLESMPLGLVNKATVRQLLTKVYLANQKFDEAISMSTKIIEDPNYQLMQNRFGVFQSVDSINYYFRNLDHIWDLHRVDNMALSANKEVIYAGLATEDFPLIEGASSMRTYVPRWYQNMTSPHGATNATGTNNRDRGLEDEVFGPGNTQSWLIGRGIAKCRTTNYSQYYVWNHPKANNDLRRKKGNWMTMEDLFYNGSGLAPKKDANGNITKPAHEDWMKPLQLFNDEGKLLCSDTIWSWYSWPAYKIYTPERQGNNPGGRQANKYIYRLAETYLLRAEANIWKGNIALAAADINVIRERAMADPIPVSEINMDVLLDERQRELMIEEPRKTELTRIAFIYAKSGQAAPNGKTYNLSNFSDNNFWYDRVMTYNNFYGNRTPHPNQTNFSMSAYHVLWPVPGDVLDANKQGVINQNKGYVGYEINVKATDIEVVER